MYRISGLVGKSFQWTVGTEGFPSELVRGEADEVAVVGVSSVASL